ncbi:MAG: flagellar hook-basal body complex protein [Deltaproteobacteria bacterium]|nr:flagellar hook-basal body complex protein [Deltaproteobacteria bacterium]
MALTSLYAGISGLNVNSDAISLIGNNIANSNTIGFKSGRIQFKDIVSSSLGGGSAGQIGRGATTGGISTLFTQSSFETTTRGTDLAVDGDGFFIVADGGTNFYTRAGDFIFDKDGLMVNSSNLTVQGWKVNEEGQSAGDIGDINVSDVSSSSKATSGVSLGANLDSTSETKFVINDYNNRFVLNYGPAGGTATPTAVVVTLINGTYTGETLANELQAKIQDDTQFSDSATGVALPADFTVTYSKVTGKFTFTNKTGNPIALDVTTDASASKTDNSMKELLGLEIKDRSDPVDGIVDDILLVDGTNVISDQLPRLSDKLFYVNNNNNTIIFGVGGVEYQAIINVQADPYTSLFASDGADRVPAADSMAVALQTALNAATQTTDPTQLLSAQADRPNFSVDYNELTGKFTIKSDFVGTVGNEEDVRFKWEDERTSAEQLLGFASEYDPNNTKTVTSFTITGSKGSVDSVYAPNTVFDSTAATYSTAMNVYDTLGSPHTVTFYFKKQGSNHWEWHAVMNSADLDNGIPNDDGSSRLMEVGPGGILEFNPNGSLKSETGHNDVYFNFGGGADLMQEIDINFGASTTEGGSGLDGTTQYADSSATFSQTQDGFPAGSLSGVNIGSDGLISGIFSNGEIKALARLALAMFNSPWGLEKKGDNIWAETIKSGNVSIGLAGTAGRGTIVSNSLEQSNVDIATEFVKMISAQRAFQANAKMITTSDELLNEVVNLKR